MQFMRFALVGVFGVATNFAVFWLSLRGGLHYLVGSFLGWFLGLLLVFVLNRLFTFQSAGSLQSDFARTLVVYVVQQIAFAGGLYACVERIGMTPTLSYVALLPGAVMISFVGMKYYAMRA